MAGGRGTRGRRREEPPESYLQRQDHELQALGAIYGADFQDLRPDACGPVGTWLVESRLACCGPASIGWTSLGQAGSGRAGAQPPTRFRILQSFQPFQFHPPLTFCPCSRSAGLQNPHLETRILPQPFLQVGSSLLPSTVSHSHGHPLIPASFQSSPFPLKVLEFNTTAHSKGCIATLFSERFFGVCTDLHWCPQSKLSSSLTLRCVVKHKLASLLPRHAHCGFRYGGNFLYLPLRHLASI